MTRSVPTTTTHTSPADPAAGPLFPARAEWVGVMLIVIFIGLFLAAAVIGPVVRSQKD